MQTQAIMRKLFLFILSISTTYFYGQSFSASISPKVQVITQGGSTSYAIAFTPTGGYSASVYLELINPACLNSSVSLGSTVLNSPYPATSILVSNTSSVPPGKHNIILHSYNGGINNYDTCTLIINSSSTPNWFVYKMGSYPLTSGFVAKTVCDANNKIWAICTLFNYFGYANPVPVQGLVSFDGVQWEGWTNTGVHFITDVCGDTLVKNTNTPFTANEYFSDIIWDGNTIVVLTSNTIRTVSSSGNFTTITSPAMSGTSNAKIRADNKGKYWMLGASAVYYQDSTNAWHQFDLSLAPFTYNNIEDWAFDQSNSIWFACYQDKGISKFDGKFWTTYNSSNSNLGSNTSYCISMDKNGDMWAGCSSAGKVYKFDGINNWTAVQFDANTSQALVFDIGFDLNGTAYIGTQLGLYIQTGSGFTLYNDNNSPLMANVTIAIPAYPQNVVFDSNNNMILADGSGGLLKYGTWVFSASIEGHKAEELSISVYPNPGNGNFSIETNSNEIQNLQIFDINGKLVVSQRLQGKANIDASNLNDGVYNISISNKQGIANKKLIIVK
jgi:hypothetical protein